MKNPAAFISYARRDDAAYGGRITALRQRLQPMVAAAIGRDFEIFQDCEGVVWGQNWRTRLDEALDEALFLIPILTPSYFNSDACRTELETFLELERRSGRTDRILSLYFLDAPVYERGSDALAAVLRERQHRDWRHLRINPVGSAKVMRALDSLAAEIAAAILVHQSRISPPMPTPEAAVAAIQPAVRKAGQNAGTEQKRTAPLERGRLVKEYLEILPERAQQLTADTERRKLAEAKRSHEIQKITEFVSRNLVELVTSFSDKGTTIKFKSSQFPKNIFSSQPFQMKLSVDEMDYWSLHFVDRNPDRIGLMLVRILRKDDGGEILTNDSIVFRWAGSDKYGFSLNERISPEDLRHITQTEQDLEKMMINLVKYELARKSGNH